MSKLRQRILFLVACCAVALRCGGSVSPAPSPATGPTITITASGITPSEIQVAVGARVLFVNRDVRPHLMSSDPVNLHSDCPAINDVGTLQPGQGRSTGELTTARTCGFHDHYDEFNNALKGRIIVQ